MYRVAEELGFVRTADFPSHRSNWQVYNRPAHPVPNFGHNPTELSSTLALYEGDRMLTHAVLRSSMQPYPYADFTGDLATLTKYYGERSPFSIYPTNFLTYLRDQILALGAGGLTGTILDSLTIRSAPVVNAGTSIGVVVGVVCYIGLINFSAARARRMVTHPDQYSIGQAASNELHREREHVLEVDLQTEIYEALEKDGSDLTPDRFLSSIYSNLPESLVSRARWEAEQKRYPDTGSHPRRGAGRSQEQLIEAARLKLQALSHLDTAAELDKRIARIRS